MDSTYDDQTEFNGKLNPVVKKEWLTRLRSGNVEQTTGALRRLITKPEDSEQKFGYCCLGVLSDMYVERNVGDSLIKWHNPEASGPLHKGSSYTLFTVDGESDAMPTGAVNLWAFANGSENPSSENRWYVFVDEDDAKKYDRYLGGSNRVYLPQMNDAGGSFADIADIIEKYL